jgi:hypothetical protein
MWLPAIKELEFWSFLPWVNNESAVDHFITIYKTVFESREPLIAGEISPDYCVLDLPMIEKIKKINPWLRIFFTIRDPIECAFSQIKLMLFVREGVKNSEFNMGEAENFSDLSDEHFLNYLEETFKWNDYVAMHQRWSSVFSSDQILVLRFEEIADDPISYLHKIARHIGIDPSFWQPGQENPKLFKKHNYIDSVGMSLNIRRILLEEYRDKALKIGEYFKFDANVWLQKHQQILEDFTDDAKEVSKDHSDAQGTSGA